MINKFNIFFKTIIKNIFLFFYKKFLIFLFTISMVKENFFKFINFFFKSNLKTWKQYLKEKHRTTKEKIARAKTWARKQEGSLGAIKGFHIITSVPSTEQAQFFQKKREEDEQKIWDEEILRNEKKELGIKDYKKPIIKPLIPKSNYGFTKNFYLGKRTGGWFNSKETFNEFWEIQTNLVKTSLIKKNKINNFINNVFYYKPINYKISYFKEINKKNTLRLKQKTKKKVLVSNFNFKFSKKYIKTFFPPIKTIPNQHIWSYLNVGYNTTEFLNFFFIQYFPTYLISFNFLKVKILLAKRFKNIFYSSHFTLKRIFFFKNISLNLFKIIKITAKKFSKVFLTNLFFFSNVYKNWQEIFFRKLIFKNLVFFFLKKTNSLFFKVYLNFLISIKKFFNIQNSKKHFLRNILISRLFGTINLFFSKSKFKRRKLINKSHFIHILKLPITEILFKEKELFFSFFSEVNLFDNFNFYNFLWCETFYSNFNILLNNKGFLSKPNLLVFFEKFSSTGQLHNKQSFLDSKKLSETFFIFLRNRVRYYENIRFLLYTSLSQQLKMVEDINVAQVLFKYILWKGKKLTARMVFLKFLKNFKKTYALPALAIFVHALLYVEPKIWLKEKKIAGRVYEIPIYISSSWSKRIAVRWLLQAAKKRKRAGIAESLTQEVWDACLKWGGAFNNKERVQLTAKKNKAYLRWF